MVAPSASFDLGELRYDAYTIASNLILVRIEDARWDEAIRAARAAVDHLEAYVGLGREVPDGVANRLEGYFTLLEAAGERGARDLRTRLERLVPSELVPDTDDDIDLGDWE